jgi:hypothetical protein
MTERKKDPTDPSSTSFAYDAMWPSWDKVNDVLGGTERMRAAGEKWLPRHENEKSSAYSNRVGASTFFNATELTLDAWVGRPFSEPVKITDIENPVLGYLEDVDLQGNDVTVFAREWFRQGMAKSFAHVLVDNPMPTGEGVRTVADDQREGVRPYFCFVRPENLISATAMVDNGKEVLMQIRIMEEEMVQVGFTEEPRRRIRIFDRVLPIGDEEIDEASAGVWFTLFEFVPADRKQRTKDRWVRVQGPTRIGIDEIPLVTFYANRQGFMVGKSPLEDLADLNISHWQSESDQTNILTVARFPMLALSGGDEEDTNVEVGPRRMLFTPDPSSKFYYVEHRGQAIEAGRKDIMDKEEKMAHYGAQFARRRPSIESATARILNSSESTTSLRAAAVRFNDALNNAVRLLGKWEDNEVTGKVAVLIDFSVEEAQTADIQELGAARTRKDLSREDYFKEMIRHGVMAEDFDISNNDRNLAKEKDFATPPPAPVVPKVPEKEPVDGDDGDEE